MPIKHTFVSSLADGPDPDQIQASHWNDAHDLSALTWGDFPVAMRPVLGNLPRLGVIAGSSSAYATKGHIYTAAQDLDILAVSWARFSGGTVWRAGAALVTSLTESGGVISAVSFSAPTESANATLTSGTQDSELTLSSPVHVLAGQRFMVYTTLIGGSATAACPLGTGAVDTYRGPATYWPNGSGAVLAAQTPFLGGAASAVGIAGNAGFVIWPQVRPA